MGELAAIAGIAGTVLKVGAGIGGAAADARAQGFKAEQAATAARYGKIAAAETDAALRQELSGVLGSIRSIRASSGIDPNSPTTEAILARESAISEGQRRTQIANILGQVASDEASAAYLKKASRDTFLYGTLGAFGQGFSSLSSMNFGSGSGGFSGV